MEAEARRDCELVEVPARTAYGQSKAESYGNGMRTSRDYDELGRLSDIDTIRRGAKIQDNTYAWRSDGSLQRRTARAGSGVRCEYFDYDYLNRLTGMLSELSEQMDPGLLVDAAQSASVLGAQRLGFLLELVGAGASCGLLKDDVRQRARNYAKLLPSASTEGATRSGDWQQLVNAQDAIKAGRVVTKALLSRLPGRAWQGRKLAVGASTSERSAESPSPRRG